MPMWGWVCLGLVGLTVAAVVLAAGLVYALLILPHEREQRRLERDGQTVVAWILLANPSLYKITPAGFEFAFLVFTEDADASKEHLAFLSRVAASLEGFEPDEDDPGEKKLAWALETQRTIGDIVRIPRRVAGRRKVFFATKAVKRRMLPEGKLTRDYLYLRVIPEGPRRAAAMAEYPDAPGGG